MRFVKFLVLGKYSNCLHIVAYKGTEAVNTMCGLAFRRHGTRTVTTLPKTAYACAGCVKNCT